MSRRVLSSVAGALLALLSLVAPGGGLTYASEGAPTVAVFPVENLSGGPIPADDIRQALIDRLSGDGVPVVPVATLDEFMVRHRVRYAAGINATTSVALKAETGADRVLFASVELSQNDFPPKIALMLRLVNTGASPTVVWADDAGLSGDDAPGFLDLGVVNDYVQLLTRATDRLGASLIRHLQTGERALPGRRDAKFRPKSNYRGVQLDPATTYTVAVLPFSNLSGRRNAGEILAGLCVGHLAANRQFRVLDIGDVREQLLQGRVVMDAGVSLSDAELVASLLEADFVLAGRVVAYEDYTGTEGRTRVEFSTVLIERRSRKVVWSSHSDNDGNDGVRLFGRGRSRTAHAMATQMVALATDLLATGRR